jgi:hypothetical protein
VLVAVAAEVVAAEYSDSPVPAWTLRVFPLAWPQPVRVAWWLIVAAAALTSRLLLARLALRPQRWVSGVIVAPFLIFAAGVALGADWATWH